MTLFLSVNNKMAMLNSMPLSSEKELQRLIEANLSETLEMHFLASEYRTDSGRIDTLAVDNDGSPVIIEYKRNKDDNVINQALSYLKWLRAQQPEFFKMLMHDRLGSETASGIKLDWRNPRIICVAEAFSKHDIDTVEVVPLRIDLYKYRNYQNGLFHLEMVAINKQQQSLVEACQAMPAETNQAIIQSMKDQSNASDSIRALFDDLRERIMALDRYIIERPGKRHIAYRLGKNFVEVQFRKDWLVIHLRPIDYQDPLGMVERIAESYTVTMNRRVILASASDLDYVFGLIEQSYQNVV